MLFGKRIDERLHGERERVLPRVYARPLELYRGQALGEQQLVDRLNDLGYAERSRVEKEGEFTIGRDAIVLIPRDGDHKGAIVRVGVRDAEAAGLDGPTGGAGSGWRASRALTVAESRIDRVTLDAPVLTALIDTGAREAPAGAASRRSRRAWCRPCWPSRIAGSTTTPASIRSGMVGAVITNLRGEQAVPGRRQHASRSSSSRNVFLPNST